MRPRPDFTLDAPNPGQLKATKTRNQQPRPAQMCCSPRGAPLYASRIKPNRGTQAYIGNLTKACECLKAVRSDAAMANRHFREEVVSRAWLLEAESLALAGRVSE